MNNSTDIYAQALEYLRNKYGTEFIYSAPCGSSITGTRSFLAECEETGGQRVLVQTENYENGKTVFRDNFLSVKYAEENRKFLKHILQKQFSRSKVFCDPAGKTLSAQLAADASFEEYRADSEGMLAAVISVEKSSYTGKEQLARALAEISGAYAARTVSVQIIVADEDTFNTADGEELRQLGVKNKCAAKAIFRRCGGSENTEFFEEG